MADLTREVAVSSSAAGLVLAARPRQWVKNVLVGAAPLAAGEVFQAEVAAATAIAFVTFCAASSSVYLVNDVVDAPRDRLHPDKHTRPVASGVLAPWLALTVAAVLAAGALAVPIAADLPELAVTLAAYLALSAAYNAGLKHQRVLDLAIVALGFLLRAVAGGAAADLPLSRWFLIVAAFGSLFVVAGKRYSELVSLGERAAQTRPSLRGYSPSYLRFVWSISAAVTITAYCLWAFEVEDRAGELPWGPLSVAPFVVAMLRFALDVDGGRTGAPEEVALRDPVLLAVCACWLGIFALGAFHV